MKLNATSAELLDGLRQVMGAVEKRNTMPALGHVLVTASPEGLTLTGTDLEIMLKAKVEGRASEPFKALLPGRKLFEICKTLPTGKDIEISVSGLKATVASGKSRFTLACLEANDFPLLEHGEVSAQVTVAKARLQSLLRRTAFAMANQDVRYYLNGLLMKLEPELLTVVATDGHRLSLNQAEDRFDVADSLQVIVPRKGVAEIDRLLAELGERVEIQFTAQHIRIASERVEFTSKLIDARYPDYERVVPTEAPSRLVADRRALKEALSRVAILSNERYRGVRLSLSGGTAKVEAHNVEQEQAEEEIDVAYVGEPMEIGFNVQYLLDVLGVIEGDEVEIQLKDANSSMLVRDPSDPRARYVIMPMRL